MSDAHVTVPVVRLEDLLTEPIRNGYSPVCGDTPTGRWVLGLGALGAAGLDARRVKPAPVGDASVERSTLRPGDFLMSRSNTRDKVGRAVMWRGEIEDCSYPDLMMRFRVDGTLIDPDYLEGFLRSIPARRHLESSASGTSGSMVKITRRAIETLPVPLPPIEEQRIIARVFSIWDSAVEKTRALLRAKSRLQAWLSLSLIDQPATSGDWSVSRMGDICRPVGRKNSEGATRVLTSSARLGLVDQLEYFNKDVSGEDLQGYYLLRRGEFAYNRSASEGYPFGAIKRLDQYDEGVLSTLNICFELVDERVSSDFLCHVFESGIMNRELGQICQVGSRAHGLLNVTKSDFFALQVPLPSRAEQDAIVAALACACREMAVLRSVGRAYTRQKQALMMALLSSEASDT
jgi:type I restriction enzyme S subunit